MPSKRRRFVVPVIALAVSFMSLPWLSSSAVANGGGPDEKVFVCKYVGTPGVDERLQTGQNPISVSVNSIPNYQGPGSYFADQHGRSYVLKVDNTPPGPAGDPDVSECPPPDGPPDQCPDGTNPGDLNGDGVADAKDCDYEPPTVVPVPVQDTLDPCNPPGVSNNVAWKNPLPADSNTVDWSESNNGATRTATLIGSNVEWSDGTTAPKVFNLPADSGVNCQEPPTVVPVPATPEHEDPCGPNNASWIEPSDDDTFQWEILPNSHLVVTIVADNTTFPGGATTHDYGKAPESGEACPPEEKVTICHATSAVNNPYVQQTVSVNAVDGVAGNSGNDADHYGEHKGPIFDPAVHQNGDDWGDIIPPVPPHHDGLNWTAEGQAIYDNDCKVPDDEPQPAEPTVQAAAQGCVDQGTSDGVVTVTVANTDDETDDTVTYDVTLDGTTKSVTIADGSSDSLEFTGLAPGTYDVSVVGDDDTSTSTTVTVEECEVPPVYNPDGSVNTGCLGNARWVLDNRGSNQPVFFEVVVTEQNTSSIRLIRVKAGDRRVIRMHGLNPGTVLTLRALDAQLDREVVPGKCDGNPPPDNPENPPAGQPNNPTYADTGMGMDTPTAANGQMSYYGLVAMAGAGLLMLGLGSIGLRRRRRVEASV